MFPSVSGYTEGDREQQSLRAFLQGLPQRGEFRLQVRVRGYATLQEAVRYAARLEQVLRDERHHDNRRPAVRGVGANSEPESERYKKSLEMIQKEFAEWRALHRQQMDVMKQLAKGHGNGGTDQVRASPPQGAGHGHLVESVGNASRE